VHIELEAGDIFLTKGNAIISRLIRFFTRGIGEKRTKVNHVGLIVSPGDLHTALVVEAIRFVTRRTLWAGYGPPKTDCVAVFRANNLSDEDIRTITARAQSMVGAKYGWPKIIAHLLDWCLLGAYVFRRLVPRTPSPRPASTSGSTRARLSRMTSGTTSRHSSMVTMCRCTR